MSEKPTETVDGKYKALEDRIHSLEIEKRLTKIHAKQPKFDAKDKSIEYLDGYADALNTIVESKNSAIAEVIPVSSVKNGRSLGNVIDEDAVKPASGSGL